MNATAPKGTRVSKLKGMDILELVETIVDKTSEEGFINASGAAAPYIKEVAARLGISAMQALFLSVFANLCDDNRIQPRDLARHFNCRTISVWAKQSVIDELVRLRVVRRHKDRDGDITYNVPQATMEALRQGKLPERPKLEGLTAKEWMDVVDSLVRQRGNDEVDDADLRGTLAELIDGNQQLHMARQLKAMDFCYSDLLLFLVMSMLYINNHDDRIQGGDIDDYFDRRDWRDHTLDLQDGTHTLMCAKLVEHSCVDGQVESDSWCLTNYAKYELYAELNLKQPTNVRANLSHYEDIKEKPLYFCPDVQKQVDQLALLLEHDKMQRVLDRLADKGLRKGFTCIFYGTPGTGKTETVLQLARQTKRDIMMVDVPSIRSKWVGETEKNIKALFDRYRKAVESAKDGCMPILLFNEADALLNKRAEGSTDSVAKMENAMQNIILQEMENLEGIMIATTNLTGALDAAFERRFLYKIKFEKPTPEARQHIWKAMLPDLSDEDALMLAGRFDFSGGQIENITRKRIISDILNDRDALDLPSIIESCKTEQLGKSTESARVGF